MIDPVTGWFEMEQIDNKTAAEAANACGTMCVVHKTATPTTNHPRLRL
jgi:hypothetical protein